jgi:lipooligosaccharide transport system permease protein
VTPLWHGVELCRTLSLGTADLGGAAVHVAYLLAFALVGCAVAQRTYQKRLNE